MYDFLDRIGLKAVLEAIKGKIPTSLPANGGDADYATNAGNADTVDGKSASDFVLKTGDTLSGNLSMTTKKLYFGVDGYVNHNIYNSDGTLRINTHDGKILAYADYNSFNINGSASYARSLRVHQAFNDIFSTSLSISHDCWNKKCYVTGQSNNANNDGYIANAPEISSAVWYEVETIGVANRAYQIAHGCYNHQRKSFIRYMHDSAWTSWLTIYTSGNKPYITGSATVAANSTTCKSNHGFTPSAVIWWDRNSSGVAVSFNGTQFVIDKTSAVDRMVYYLIFK